MLYVPIAYGLILLWLHSLQIDNVGERHGRDGTGQYDDAHRVAANTGKRLYALLLTCARYAYTYARYTDDEGMLWDMILGPTSEAGAKCPLFHSIKLAIRHRHRTARVLATSARRRRREWHPPIAYNWITLWTMRGECPHHLHIITTRSPLARLSPPVWAIAPRTHLVITLFYRVWVFL